MKNIYGNHVFITGASSGIGRACAEMFAKAGCQVVGTSRHCEETKTEYPGGGQILMKRMDVTKEEEVKAIVASLPAVDIAVLAAGMGVAGPCEELPVSLAREQMETNYLGVLTVGHYILPLMRKQGHGLFLVIGSIAGRVSIPMQSHYSSSKYALEAYVDAVRMEMKRFGVKTCILEPGDTKTGFTAARKSSVSKDSPYYAVAVASIDKMAKDEQNGRSPDTVAKAAIKTAGRKNPPARIPIGFEYKLLMFILRLLPDRLKEKILSLLYLPKA